LALETPSPAILRFGTFEVDLRGGELRKQGVRIKLQEQPFLVLKVLLGRSGEIVTREELRSQIWSANTFVDFDNSLNTAINKLREALADSADNPRFIETLPRRGYRFVAPVSGAGPQTPAPATAGQRADRLPRWRRTIAVAAVLLAAVAGVFWLWRSRRAPVLTETDTIVLADFANTTGEHVFDDTLKQGLRVQLEQSPFLNVLSDEQVAQELRLMAQPPDVALSAALARDLCQRIGSKALLTGSISSLGSHYVIGLNAMNCQTGATLAAEQSEVPDKEHLLAVLGIAASRIRKKLGESLASIEKFDAPLEQVTTPSLEAFRAYSVGMKYMIESKHREAQPYFLQAIALDPNFASAYVQLARINEYLGHGDVVVEDMKKAYALRDRVSQREQFHIAARYFSQVYGDQDKVWSLAELWAETYPRDSFARLLLADTAMWQGDWQTGVAQGRIALDLDPGYTVNYQNLAISQLALGDYVGAARTCDRAASRNINDSGIHLIRYWIAFVRQDQDAMAAELKILAGLTPQETEFEPDFLKAQMASALYFGKWATARNFLPHIASSLNRIGADDDTANTVGLYTQWALFNAELGNTQEARISIRRALAKHADPGFGARLALASARAREISLAEKSADEFEAKYHSGWFSVTHSTPVARAAIALARGDAAKAIELLRVVTGDAQWWGPNDPTSLDGLFSAYLRGQAYLSLGQGQEAAAEFRRLVDHPGIVVNSPFGPLARVGLARAYVLQGDTAKARSAYQDFLTIWKDADSDIPVLIAAKSEYAKLK
jgi:eukaryotic-like serine/threonine-protein kinase